MRNRVAMILLCGALVMTLAGCSGAGVGLDLPFRAGGAEQAVELTAEPSHHLAFENPYVRVFKVEAAPHATTLMHRHNHDYIYVVLGAAQITNTVEGKAPVSAKLRDGEVAFAPGPFSHKVTNNADTPFRNITVEVLKPKKDDPAASVEARGIEAGHGVMEETLFIKDGVTAREIMLNPGAMLPAHAHKTPHLVIAVSALELKNSVVGQGVAEARMQPGDIKWVDAGVTNSLMNLGKAPARFVTLEFE
jgi:quercetin dioxygenase-like cupin family protein